MSEEDVTTRLAEAITGALPGNYVTRWAALIEVIDETGERSVWCTTADDMRAWDTLGLLTFGIQLEQAALIRDDD